MSHIYLGGSRNPKNISPAQIAQVVGAVIAAGHSVHVGCQVGADQTILQNLPPRSSHRVFTVHACGSYPLYHHISRAYHAGHHIAFCAGGASAPMPARYLLRSLAAMRGCSAAVFFQPGTGSLAVASHAVQSSIPVYAFSVRAPQSPRGGAGRWVASSFAGYPCWLWQSAQLSLI